MKIKANDFVKHIPSGERWVVCGVDYEKGKLIPNGWPFPSIVKISDCELIESRNIPQREEQKNALERERMYSFIE